MGIGGEGGHCTAAWVGMGGEGGGGWENLVDVDCSLGEGCWKEMG